MAGTGPGGEDLAALEHAIETLESQRAILGDAVVDTALVPLQARRNLLAQQAQGEQRRLVTVVFADLVGFTELSAFTDPEDTRAIVDLYFSRWLAVIESHGGTVEKFIGDAVMAVFGVARSWEDDAQRAVRASLAMVAALPELNTELQSRYGVSVSMRVGVDTGEVVVSTLGDRDGEPFVVVGPTVNRAARLQAAAPVDGVLVSSDTHRQIRGRFNLRPVQPLTLKGIDEPVAALQVVSERPHTFQLDRACGVEGISTTTVGRDSEQRFLQDRLHDVIDAQRWQVLTVVGEAGVGKTRLLSEFDSWLAEIDETVWWFRGRASQANKHSAHALLRDLVAGRCEIAVSDSPEQVRAKLEQGFALAYPIAEEARRQAHLVGSWLRFDLGEVSVPAEPQTLRDLAGEALADYLRRLSAVQPVVILFEDLHWADDGSLRWLDTADAVLAEAPVLVVATARSTLLEDRPRWGEGLAHHSRLVLPPLSRRESRALLRQILHKVDDAPEALLTLVIESSEGNPYYLEELVTWLIDAGIVVKDEPHWRVVHELVGGLVVPSTLRGVLQSRLDALGREERGLLQRASVVGRVFWDQAVERLDDHDTDSVGGRLDDLRQRELVFLREGSSFELAREFVFKHALLRDVAYDSLLRAHRQRYHGRAAAWLVAASERVGRQGEYAAIIADHLARAGDPDAGGWYLRAGQQAASVFALTEACQLLGRALDLVVDDLEMRFDILLAREQVLDRLGDRDAQSTDLTEMAELDLQLDSPGRHVRMCIAYSRLCFGRSDHDEAETWAEDAIATASEHGLAADEAEARLWLGKALAWHDEVDAARSSLLAALNGARRTNRPLLVAESLRYLSIVANNEGLYDEALARVYEAREVFASAGDAEGAGTALAQSASTLYNLGRLDDARAALERVVPIFRRSGHRYRSALVGGNIGTIAFSQGRLGDARRWCTEAVEAMQVLGDREATANGLLVLGQIATVLGEWQVAADHIDEALALAADIESAATATNARSIRAVLALDRGADGLHDAREAVAAGELATSSLERGHAQLVLGYATLTKLRPTEGGSGDVTRRPGGLAAAADHAFAEAEEHFASLRSEVLAREAAVGRAAVALAGSDLAGALALVEPVLDHLDAPGLAGAARPAVMLHTCWQVLARAEDPRAPGVLEQARVWVRDTAAQAGDPVMAGHFLAAPVNAALLRADDAEPATAAPAAPVPAPG